MDPITLVIISMAVLVLAATVLGANFVVVWNNMDVSVPGLIVHIAAAIVAGLALLGVLVGIAWTLAACYA